MSGDAREKAAAVEEMVQKILAGLPDALGEDFVDVAAAYPGSGERPERFAPWLEILPFGGTDAESSAGAPVAAFASAGDPIPSAGPQDAGGREVGAYDADLRAMGVPSEAFPVCTKLLSYFEEKEGFSRERALEVMRALQSFVDSVPAGDLDTVRSYLSRRGGE